MKEINNSPVTYHQRDFFVSKIIAGFLIYRQEDEVIRIYHPSSEVEYVSNIIYNDVLEEAKEHGIFTGGEIFELLLTQGWTEKKEALLNTIPSTIERMQVELYQAIIAQKPLKDKIRNELGVLKKNLVQLNNERHKFDIFTCHGVALQSKIQYSVSQSTDPFCEAIEAVQHYNNNILDPELIRYLSRTTPWFNVWQSAKGSGQVFNKAGVDLSKEQQLILFWSKLYDNIHESPDCPPQGIIQDDDALDGWLTLQRKKDSKNEIKGSGEVFIIMNKEELEKSGKSLRDEAKRIYDLNTPMDKAIVKNRLDMVNKKGEVKYTDFADVQQKRMMARNNAAINAMKAKK